MFAIGAPFVGLNAVAQQDAISLNSNMGLDDTYEAYRNTSVSGATCQVDLNILSDGTWTVTKTAAASWQAGTTFSGNWGVPTTPAVGNDYEVSFNNGSSWQTLNVTRTHTMLANDTTDNGIPVTVESTFTVIVRKLGTTSPTSSDTLTLRAIDEYNFL